MEKLKIYLIEDDKKRREGMKAYFKSVNRLLSGKAYDDAIDYEDCHKCFQENNYTEVELIEILPDVRGRGNYCNYEFEEEKDWVKKIGSALANDEDRIFLLDLALNHAEKKALMADGNNFRAKTARSVLDYIEKNTKGIEVVVIESVIKNASKKHEKILDMGVDDPQFKNLSFSFMLGDYFYIAQDRYEKIEAISGAFRKAISEMKTKKQEIADGEK